MIERMLERVERLAERPARRRWWRRQWGTVGWLLLVAGLLVVALLLAG